MTAGYIGRYRVLGELGRGAMGVVYRALDENLDREVAVKVMSSSHAHDEEAKKRFLREGRAAGRLQHPNIVAIYELGEHAGAPFMAMELLEGRDLQQAIKQGLRPNPRATLPIVLQVLAGLAHAHEHGIVHRDIKPANIFLPKGRPAKIMDFGIARLTQGTMTAGNMTSVGSVVGTPNYMSPEQVRGANLDARSDLFSTGLILYELVTGEKAYQGDSIVSLLFRISQGPPEMHLPSTKEWARLRAVLERALAHDPDDRYPDARAMESDLALALADLGGASDTTGASDRGVLRTRAASRADVPSMTLPPPAATAVAAPPTVVAPPPTAVTPAHDPWSIPVPETQWGDVADAPRRTYRHVPAPAGTPRPEPPSRAPMLLGLAGVLVVLAGGGMIAWNVLGRRAPDPAVAAPSPLPTLAPVPSAAPTAAAVVAPPPSLPAATAVPAPTARPTRAPETLRRTPPPETAETPEPVDVATGRLDKANDHFERGRYAQALAEARAVLRREPGNTQARALVEDAEAAIAVETAIKKAREFMKKGDDEAAMAHVRAGLAVAPADARLLALFRELNAR